MGITNRVRKITTAFESSIRRFPLTALAALMTCIFLISIVELKKEPTLLIQRLTMIFALSIPITLSAKLAWEKKKDNNLLFYYLVSIIFIIFYFFVFLKNTDYISISRFVGTNLIFYLMFLFIPYFFKRKNFEMYSIKILGAFFITAIYTVVLFAGLSAILFTIDKLLGIRIDPELYIETWFVCVFIFAVNYFLSLVPKIEITFTKEVFPKAFNILLNYIVIPLLSVYTTILYIYFFKILITQNWPKGLVSHLVLWYSFITILVVFFTYPIKEDIKVSNYFAKIITKIILPLIIMMFVSMGIRINAYGVTEPRYYVIVAGIWVLCVFLYWNISKIKINTIIPLSFVLTIFIALFTPISSFNISRYSQTKRFENLLVKNNMLKEGKIQKNPNISQDDKSKISSIVLYFENRQGLDKLKYLPNNFNISQMNEVFGFNLEDRYIPRFSNFYFRTPINSSIDIKGYDYLIYSNIYNINIEGITSGNVKFEYDKNKNILHVTKDNKKIYSLNLVDKIRPMYDKFKNNAMDKELPISDLTIIEENENIKIKFILNNVSGMLEDDNTIRIDGCELYIMYSLK